MPGKLDTVPALTTALEAAITRLQDDPHGVLFDKNWDFAGGLDARGINQFAESLKRGPLFELAVIDNESRVLTVHNSDPSKPPIKWTIWATVAGPLADFYRDGQAAARRESKLQRTLDWLRSWVTASPSGPGKGKRIGRGRLTESKKPELQARLNVYELIRAVKLQHRSWGAQKLQDHFKADLDFRQRVREAGETPTKKLFRAALTWIARNPRHITQPQNVS